MPQRVAGPTGEFLPDIQSRDNPGVTVAQNVLPHVSGYTPARDLAASQASITGRCLGAYATKDFDGNVHNYAGDATTLYELVSGSYTDVGQTYALIDPRTWQFGKINNDMLAANGIDPIQVQDDFTGSFEDIATASDPTWDDAPAAQYLAEVAGFVVTGWQPTAQNKVQWSGLRNPYAWTNGVEQAGEQILQSGGSVTGVVGGEYGVIFTEHSIHRMNYTGDPSVVFQIDEISPGRGTTAPGSISQYGDIVFFIDTDGFYRFDGSVARPIGSNKLNHWFIKDYDSDYAHRVRSAIDTKNALVYWAYPSKSAAAGQPDKMIVYDILTGRFAGPVLVEVEELFYAESEGTVLLDEFLAYDSPGGLGENPLFEGWTAIQPDGTPPVGDPALDTDLDMDVGEVLNYSVDDGLFKGGNPLLSAFNTSHTFSTFTGDVLLGKIESAEVNFIQGGRALLTGFRALVDGAAPNTSVSIGYRDKTSGTVTWTSPITPNEATELVDVLIDARYHRFRICVDGDYDFIFGGEPEYERAGYG